MSKRNSYYKTISGTVLATIPAGQIIGEKGSAYGELLLIVIIFKKF
jgi:hypothetical protein